MHDRVNKILVETQSDAGAVFDVRWSDRHRTHSLAFLLPTDERHSLSPIILEIFQFFRACADFNLSGSILNRGPTLIRLESNFLHPPHSRSENKAMAALFVDATGYLEP